MTEVEDGSDSAQSMATASPEKLVNYLRKIVPVILEDYDGVEVPALNRAFGDKNGSESLRKFISDPQSRALLVSRHFIIAEEDEADSAPTSVADVYFSLSADVHYSR
jgi:dynein heavy chain 1